MVVRVPELAFYSTSPLELGTSTIKSITAGTSKQDSFASIDLDSPRKGWYGCCMTMAPSVGSITKHSKAQISACFGSGDCRGINKFGGWPLGATGHLTFNGHPSKPFISFQPPRSRAYRSPHTTLSHCRGLSRFHVVPTRTIPHQVLAGYPNNSLSVCASMMTHSPESHLDFMKSCDNKRRQLSAPSIRRQKDEVVLISLSAISEHKLTFQHILISQHIR